jgi:hypothetical protein
MKQLDHKNPELSVRVIDVDDPGTGRNARTLMRPFADLQPEIKTAFVRASEKLNHRASMKAGGLKPPDKRDVGLSLTFASRMDEFLHSTAQTEVKLEVFSAYVEYTVQCYRSEMATGMYRKATSSAPISIPGFRLVYCRARRGAGGRMDAMSTRHGVMPSMDLRTFGQTGRSSLRRSTGASKTG